MFIFPNQLHDFEKKYYVKKTILHQLHSILNNLSCPQKDQMPSSGASLWMRELHFALDLRQSISSHINLEQFEY